MQYPLLAGDYDWFPEGGVCKICGVKTLSEDRPHVRMSLSAILCSEEDPSTGGPSHLMELSWYIQNINIYLRVEFLYFYNLILFLKNNLDIYNIIYSKNKIFIT